MRHALLFGTACGLLFTSATMVNAAPTDSWTGFYAGASGGYGWQTDKVPGVSGLNPSGAVGDVQIGYDREIGPVVLGVRGDAFPAPGLPGRASVICPAGYCAPVPVTIGTHANMQWLLGIGGRLGVPFGRWMPYVTGGYHFENEKVMVTESTMFGSTSTTQSAGGSGAYVGGGLEYRLNHHLSMTVEYLNAWSRFGKLNADATTGVVLGGLHYKF